MDVYYINQLRAYAGLAPLNEEDYSNEEMSESDKAWEGESWRKFLDRKMNESWNE